MFRRLKRLIKRIINWFKRLFMRNNISLYLNGQLAELGENPDIQFNYAVTDHTNPTVIKNSYSKTVSLPGTPTNERIFSQLSKLDRTQHFGRTDYWNPSQRVSFSILNNGTLVEEGYAKIDNIIKTGNRTTYQLTLYGGLSQFFFNLSYASDGSKLKLSDLSYLGGTDDELNFRINRQSVSDAWDRLSTGNGDAKWDVVNFAVTYEGLPDDFDSDRVLINTNSLDCELRQAYGNQVHDGKLADEIESDDTIYRIKGGYADGNLMKECTSFEVRDLRSYLQRPVFNIRKMVEACCNPVNNGGYRVDLDSHFFNDENPYWNKAWATLPRMGDFDKEMEILNQDLSLTSRIVSNVYNVDWTIVEKSATTSTVNSKYIFSFDLQAVQTAATEDKLYLAANGNLGGIAFQIVGYDADNEAIAGTNIMVVTNMDNNGNVIDMVDMMAGGGYTPYYDAPYKIMLGYYQKVANTIYRFNNRITLTMDLGNADGLVETFKLRMNYLPYRNESGAWATSPRRKYLYPNIQYNNISYVTDSNPINLTEQIYTKTDGGMHSDTLITKSMLFGAMDGTPCDWLLSYCKLFGLFLVKDPYEKKISIMTRGTYYSKSTVDIEEQVDRNKELNINPLTFDSKWYSMKYKTGNDKSEFEDKYFNTYGNDYGRQMIDTQYNFDVNTKELFDTTKFTNGVMALEKDNWYSEMIDGNNNIVPSAFHNWVTVKYLAGSGEDSDELEVPTTYPSIVTDKLFDDSYIDFWDSVPKLQIHGADNEHKETNSTLLFYDGKQTTGNEVLWLTDDVARMYRDSDNPCWLITNSPYDKKGKQIAQKMTSIPYFTRYLTSDNSNRISTSWDFGRTKELYVPNISWASDRDTIYEKYWQDYIQDLYSVNTRTVEAYIQLKGQTTQEALRRFYWFDNCLWTMTKIDGYSAALRDTVKCTFTKVNNKQAYTSQVYYPVYTFDVYRSNGNLPISYTGTTTDREVIGYVKSNVAWTVSVNNSSLGNFDTSGGYVTGSTGSDEAKYFRFVFNVNTTPETRRASFTVRRTTAESKSFSVIQQAYKGEQLHLTIEPQSIDVPKAGGTYSFIVDSSSPWRAKTPQISWVDIITNTGEAGQTPLKFTVKENTGESARTATIVLMNNEHLGVKAYVNQKATSELSLTRGGTTAIPYSGGTDSYTVKAEGNWTIVKDRADYLTISPMSGSGNTVLNVVYSANGGYLTRTPKFHISQGEKTAYAANYGVQSANQHVIGTLPAAGGTITAYGGGYKNAEVFGWKLTNGNTWLYVNPTQGTDNNIQLTLSASTNTSTLRQGYMSVEYNMSYGVKETETLMIKQTGGNNFSVSPTTINMDWDDAKDYTITVTASNEWTYETAQSWIHVKSKGDSTLTFYLDNNTGENSRTGSITFKMGSQTLSTTINQSGKPITSSLSIAPTNLSKTSDEFADNIAVTTNTSWSASTTSSWISINPISGTGSQTVIVGGDENTGGTRTGTVVFKTLDNQVTKTLTITQQGNSTVYYILNFTTIPSTATVKLYLNDAETPYTPNMKVAANTRVRAYAIASGYVNSDEYTAVMTSDVSTTLKCKQYPTWDLSDEKVIGYNSQSITVNVTDVDNVGYEIASLQSWVTISNNTISVSENNTGEVRSAMIGLKSNVTATVFATCRLLQTAKGTLSVSPTTIDFNSNGGSNNISIVSNTSWTISITKGSSWLTAMTKSGNGNATVEIDASANSSSEARDGMITITSSDNQSVNVVVNQEGSVSYFTLKVNSIPSNAVKRITVDGKNIAYKPNGMNVPNGSNVVINAFVAGDNSYMEATPINLTMSASTTVTIKCPKYPSWNLDEYINSYASGDSIRVTITDDDNVGYSVASDSENWLTYSNGMVTIQFNDTENSRIGILTLTADDGKVVGKSRIVQEIGTIPETLERIEKLGCGINEGSMAWIDTNFKPKGEFAITARISLADVPQPTTDWPGDNNNVFGTFTTDSGWSGSVIKCAVTMDVDNNPCWEFTYGIDDEMITYKTDYQSYPIMADTFYEIMMTSKGKCYVDGVLVMDFSDRDMTQGAYSIGMGLAGYGSATNRVGPYYQRAFRGYYNTFRIVDGDALYLDYLSVKDLNTTNVGMLNCAGTSFVQSSDLPQGDWNVNVMGFTDGN